MFFLRKEKVGKRARHTFFGSTVKKLRDIRKKRRKNTATMEGEKERGRVVNRGQKDGGMTKGFDCVP